MICACPVKTTPQGCRGKPLTVGKSCTFHHSSCKRRNTYCTLRLECRISFEGYSTFNCWKDGLWALQPPGAMSRSAKFLKQHHARLGDQHHDLDLRHQNCEDDAAPFRTPPLRLSLVARRGSHCHGPDLPAAQRTELRLRRQQSTALEQTCTCLDSSCNTRNTYCTLRPCLKSW